MIKETTRRPTIVIPDDFPAYIAGTAALARLGCHGDVSHHPTRSRTEEELVRRMSEADVIVNIRAYTKLTREVLQRLPALKMISVLGTGTDNVDLNAAAELGVTVTSTQDVATEAVAEHALALMLAVARNIPAIHERTREGRWERGLVTQLCGKTLGIVGTGLIGTQMARLGRGIGMNVVAWSPHPSKAKAGSGGFRYVSFDELLRNADVISLHLRLCDRTIGVIGNREFDLMKTAAILVNTARGGLIDKGAFVSAMWRGRIAGAGLDVYDQEPVPPGDPLLKLDRLVLTPHCAGMVPEAVEKTCERAVDNVIAFLQGEPANVVAG